MIEQIEIDVIVQPTPNPNALKFVMNKNVIEEGKASFKAPFQCENIPLGLALFDLRGVDSLHFFENTITITKFSFEPWDNLEDSVITTLKNMMPSHNPSIEIVDPRKERLKNLSPEMRQIEEILDSKIRPGLQGDGGDLVVLSYENSVLVISYQGACGTCPSSTTGTLEAIKAILRDEFDPGIEVYAAPSETSMY